MITCTTTDIVTTTMMVVEQHTRALYAAGTTHVLRWDTTCMHSWVAGTCENPSYSHTIARTTTSLLTRRGNVAAIPSHKHRLCCRYHALIQHACTTQLWHGMEAHYILIRKTPCYLPYGASEGSTCTLWSWVQTCHQGRSRWCLCRPQPHHRGPGQACKCQDSTRVGVIL